MELVLYFTVQVRGGSEYVLGYKVPLISKTVAWAASFASRNNVNVVKIKVKASFVSVDYRLRSAALARGY